MEEVIGIIILSLFVLGTPFLALLLFINHAKNKITDDIKRLNSRIQDIQSGINELKSRSVIIPPEPEQPQEQKQPETEITPEIPKENVNIRWSKPAVPVVTQKDEVIWEIENPEPKLEHEHIISPVDEKVRIQEPIFTDKEIIETNYVVEMQDNKESRQSAPPLTGNKQTTSTKKDYEKFFGVNLLSKIGIATLVLGIAYFVKYAIDQNWINEIGRVTIGILAGASLIGVAHKLRQNFRTFSSILIGGGISVLYITIALAFWDYKLFSQSVAFSLLIIITVLSVFLSIAYDKKELAIFSLLGGFASPLIVSTGTGNYIVLFSYIFILNTGMLILAFKKKWKLVSIIAYILTQGFYWTWLLSSFKDQYIGATLFGAAFFIQFYLLAMIDHFKEGRKITPFQVMIILGNNLSLFAGAIYIFNDYPVDLKGLITVSLALLNAIPLWMVFKDKKFNKNMLYLLVAIVLSFISLAIPIQLDGCVITMFWAAETVILLFLYQKSSIKVFKTGYTIIQLLVLISMVMDWNKYYDYYMINYAADYILDQPKILSIILNEPFITGLVVIISMGINYLMIRKREPLYLWGEDTYSLQTILKILAPVMIFFTLFLELRYQANVHSNSRPFINLVLGLYIYTFFAVYVLIKWKKTKWMRSLYITLILLVVSFVSVYMYIVYLVREDVLANILSDWGYFSLHYLSIPAIIVFFIFLLKKTSVISAQRFNISWIYWFLCISSVIIFSMEIDHVSLILFSGHLPEEQILSYSHTIAYPIVWGIISFILMALGMKQKNRSLRIISLSLFALIIAKLYLYDIWKMNQTGRIIAFVFLGLLFLLVSFLYQKLKVLLQKKDEEEK